MPPAWGAQVALNAPLTEDNGAARVHQVAAEQNRGPPRGEDGDTHSTGAAHGPELTVMDIYQSFSSQLAANAMVAIQSLLAHGELTERVHSIINFTADMCRAGRSTGSDQETCRD